MGRDREVLEQRQVVEQLDALPCARQAVPRTRVRRQGGQILSVQLDLPARGDEAADRVDEGRLPGPVRADQADELTLADLEVDVDDRAHASEADRDAGGLQDGAHCSPPSPAAVVALWTRSSRATKVGAPTPPTNSAYTPSTLCGGRGARALDRNPRVRPGRSESSTGFRIPAS